MSSYDFFLERRLKETNIEFARRYSSCTSLFEQMLKKFLSVFPTFTDHSLLHTLSVINISNHVLRDNVEKLNPSEIYIYLMACALHDIGMGVSDKDLDLFIDAAGLRAYRDEHPEIEKPNFMRKFHNDLSAEFVKKYWEILEIPSERYAEAIAEVGRGHRKTDLFDEALYPTAFDLSDGTTANLALLAALIRLCDELDIASDRNPEFLFDMEMIARTSEESLFEFSKHGAIHRVEFSDDEIVVFADTDKEGLVGGIIDAIRTVHKTLTYCLSVIEARSDFKIDCKSLKLILNQQEICEW